VSVLRKLRDKWKEQLENIWRKRIGRALEKMDAQLGIERLFPYLDKAVSGKVPDELWWLLCEQLRRELVKSGATTKNIKEKLLRWNMKWKL
jgi:hypothetical protein